jgi:long-chain acyl-CoA synthetase
MLVESFLSTAQEHADRVAVADPRLRLTYRELIGSAVAFRRLAGECTTRERLALMLPSCAAFASAYVGTLWADRVPVPLSPLLQSRELAAILADAGADCLLTTRLLEKQIADVPVRTVFLEDVLMSMAGAAAGKVPPPPNHAPQDVATVLYTSGSSGMPKGVCLTHHNLHRNATACIEHARMNPEQSFLSVLPPSHAFGLTAMVIVPMVLGTTVHYLPRFQPAQVVETIQRERISVFMAVPSMYAAMLRLKDMPADALSALNLAISGGEPLPVNVAAAFEQRWHKRLHEGYGLTETSPVISINMPWSYRPGSVGLLLPGLEARIVREDGSVAPADECGEIQVRGHCVMKAYLNRPEETAAVIDRDGWFRTGDAGRLDADGYLFITGRLKDVIIVGGDNVYPKEVEDVLVQHPAVAEAAVVGRPDSQRGEVVVAYVTVIADDADPVAMRSFCRDRLAGYKVPREVVIVAEMPRGPTGKILKRQLAGLG